MIPLNTIRRVFLSSVGKGLETYRDAVFEAIGRLDGYHYVRMEDFGARGLSPEEHCVAAVKSCESFVGIVGPRYGNGPPSSLYSFSEIEYQTAVRIDMVRLIFVTPEDFPMPANLVESDQQRRNQARFRQENLKDRTVAFFTNEADLVAKVSQAFHNLLLQRPEPKDSAVKTYLLFPFVVSAHREMAVTIRSSPYPTSGRIQWE